MRGTYAVTWVESDAAASQSGKLELRSSGLRLEGGTNGAARITEVPYADVAGVRVGRGPGDRIGDRPTVVVKRRSGASIRIASVAQAGIVAELAQHLTRHCARGQNGSPT